MSIELISRLRRSMAATGLALLGGAIACTGSSGFANDGLPAEMAADMDSDVAYRRVIDQHLYGNVAPSSEPVQLTETYGGGGGGGEYYGNVCGCEAVGCDGGCDGRGGRRKGGLFAGLCKSSDCPPPWWAHRSGAFAELLILTAGSSDIIHAVEFTGPTPADSPTGPMGIVDIGAEAGFRVGAILAGNQCNSLNATYSYWSGSDQDTLNATGTNVLNSQLLHPSLLTTGAASLQATAQHDISFQHFDLNYRHLWKRSESMALNWFGGVRYGNMEQNLIGAQTIQVATGLQTVTTDIDFDGFGINAGADFERYNCHTGMFLYGKGMASLMAGEWDATYREVNQFGGGRVANNYEDFHATPVLEGELGLGWRKHDGRVRLQAGYMMSGWYDAVSTRGYVDAVRRNNLIDIGETITFSGLTTRLTFLF